MIRVKPFIGKIKRAVFGFLLNKFERIPEFPSKCKKTIVGHSMSGAALSVYTFGHGEKNILFVGGIHGNEVGTIKLMRRFLAWLSEKPAAVKDYKIHILPCLNPDGYTLAQKKPDYFNDGRTGRFNGNGVDLNRNFPTKTWLPQSHWTHGHQYQERTAVHCGTGPGSEPEIQALTRFIKARNIKVLYVFHNKARDVMGNRNKISQALTQLYAAKTGFKYFSDEDWKELKQTGTAKEWCEENGVAYIEVEGSTRYGSDWKKQAPALKSQLEVLRKYV